MKDQLGLYYHPQPGNVKARVYVRRGADTSIEFRLWQQEHPEVWEKHQWLSSDIIRSAAAVYKQSGRSSEGANPMLLYDENVAKALLAEEGK